VSLAELDTEGVTATFICANAQTYPFAGKLRPDRVAIRRDGSSQDSVEALANLGRAARLRRAIATVVRPVPQPTSSS
jgi:hypothetical protein